MISEMFRFAQDDRISVVSPRSGVTAGSRRSEAATARHRMTAKRNWLILDMTVDVQERLHARPFTPFTIHVADGRKFDVATPDHAHVWPNRARVSIYTDQGLECILPALLISGVDVQEKTNGQQNRI